MIRFGKRVLGEEAHKRQQKSFAEAKARAFAYGPRVTGIPRAKRAAAAPAKPGDSKPATGQGAPEGGAGAGTDKGAGSAGQARVLSLKEMEKALGAEPAEQLLDELIAAEFERPEGEPRKGALRLLLAAEQARGDAARPTVVADLKNALGG